VIWKGYRTLWAYPWYLDQQSPGMDPKESFYEWVDTWMAFYKVSNLEKETDDTEKVIIFLSTYHSRRTPHVG
jgi:hypothetical protein